MIKHYTDTSAHADFGTNLFRKIRININTGWTGTLTVKDGAAANTLAIITNPVVGNFFEYWNVNGISVQASATPDYTVMSDNSRGGA